MKHPIRLSRSHCIPAFLAAIPATLWGQAAPAPQDTAATNGRSYGGLAEITITAERRTQTVQKSDLSLQVLSRGDVARADITQAKDLTSVVPGLQIAQGGEATQIFIRGVGDLSATLTSNPGVAYNVDGVVVARPEEVGMAFYDISRIEVVKGPQGTLYGRNSTGGAINVITNKPDLSRLSGYLTLEGGNLDMKHSSGAVNIPINSTLAVRGAFDVVNRAGYLSDGTSDDKHEAGRVRLLWQPSDRISMLTTVDYAHVHGNGVGYVPNPRPAGSTQFLGSGDTAAIAYLASQSPLAAGMAYGVPPFTYGLSFFSPFVDNRAWDLYSDFQYDMGWATLTLLPAYRDFQDAERNYPGFQNTESMHSLQSSFEARLNKETEYLKWVAGFYLYKEDLAGSSHIDRGVPIVLTATYPIVNTRSYAGFGQATYSVLRNWRFILGGRYTHDQSSLLGQQTSLAFLSVPGSESFSGSTAFNSFTWKAGTEFDLTAEHMIYLTASTGFKAGGLNYEPPPNAYRPEKLMAYEFGARNRFLNDRVQVNLELFDWDLQNHQEGIVTFDSTNQINFLFKNAGSATMRGFNVDLAARITPRDTLRTFVEFNHAYYNSFVANYAASLYQSGFLATGCTVTPSSNGAPSLVSFDCSGREVAHVPRWTGSASLQHIFELADGATIEASARGQYTDTQWGSIDFTPEVRLPAVVTGDVDLTYTPESARWSATAYVHNVSNVLVATGAQTLLFQPTVTYWTVNPPRTYGGRITLSF